MPYYARAPSYRSACNGRLHGHAAMVVAVIVGAGASSQPALDGLGAEWADIISRPLSDYLHA